MSSQTTPSGSLHVNLTEKNLHDLAAGKTIEVMALGNVSLDLRLQTMEYEQMLRAIAVASGRIIYPASKDTRS